MNVIAASALLRANADDEPPFQGEGEMRRLCRGFDWDASALGSVRQWSPTLRALIDVMLAMPNPAMLVWGPEFVQVYNDAYRDIMGATHPAGLGLGGQASSPDTWHTAAPLYARVLTGETVYIVDAAIPIMREGLLDDAWFTVAYVPVRDHEGIVAGALVSMHETTDRVFADRENLRICAALDRMNAAAAVAADVQPRVLVRRAADQLLIESERARVDAVAARTFAEAAWESAEKARADAEAANLAKGRFLTVMSHELRTPLNAIGGYADLIELGIRGPVTPVMLEDLRRIQLSKQHLLGLINDVLDYAKLETGTLDYRFGDIAVWVALSAAEALISPIAQSKGIQLEVHGADEGLTVHADHDKLCQILVNLLSNAVKFTAHGGQVRFSVAPTAHLVLFHVRDSGIGIAPDALEQIFAPFVQVRTDRARLQEGTGLGLSISRELARGMGGDITVQSAPREGSTFTLTLPRRLA
ncbi:MAG: ATP-binding protein [Gemmatimonadaceae bacterium]